MITNIRNSTPPSSFADRVRGWFSRLRPSAPLRPLPRAENVVIARGFANFHTSDHWNFWATRSWLNEHSSSFTEEMLIFPELFVKQIEIDFGYTIFPPSREGSYDGSRLDLVLDPGSQGGARTGSTFGPFGISISPDAAYNDYHGEVGFWYRILALHESVNVWTGCLASGWVWADGSPLWKGSSPFPNMCDFVITEEIGYARTSKAQKARMMNDNFVELFYRIQKRHGWHPFQGLFALVKQNRIHDWHAFDEPLRTAVLVLFMSRAAEADLLGEFQMSGVSVTDEAYARAEMMLT